MTSNAFAPGGKHLILELWDCTSPHCLEDNIAIEKVLKAACEDAGATVLFSNFHHFGKGCGVTGVVGLSESHCSIHTWPESGYASIDVYMCGTCDPTNAIPRIREFFKPKDIQASVLHRGRKAILPAKTVAA